MSGWICRNGMKSRSQEPLLTVKESAQVLGVASNTVRAWGAVGKLSGYRRLSNGYRLYKRSDFEPVLDQVELLAATEHSDLDCRPRERTKALS